MWAEQSIRTRQPILQQREHAISRLRSSCTMRTIIGTVGYVSQREGSSIRHMRSLLDGQESE